MKTTSVGKDMKKLGSLYIAGGTIGICSHFGKQSSSSSKSKTQLPYDPFILLQICSQEKCKYLFRQKLIHEYSSLSMCGFPTGSNGKEPACQCRRYKETQIQSLGRGDSLEKEMATHCVILAWRIPWTEEPGRLQSLGLQRVRHNWKIVSQFLKK